MNVTRLSALAIASVAMVLGGAPGLGVSSATPDFGAIDSYVRSQMSDAHLPGVAIGIVHGAGVVHVQGFGQANRSGSAVTADTPFIIGSLSKSFTALAVMQLAEAGTVNLDAPAQQYVPEFRLQDAADSSQITVRQLLNQTSGIPTQAGIDPLTGPVTTLADQVRAIGRVAPQTKPGVAYAYSNANYEVLGRLVELVSGQTYGDYVEQHVFAPLGMSHSVASTAGGKTPGLAGGCAIWFGVPRCLEPGTGFRPDFVPAGFITSTAADMSRYMAVQLNGGSFDGATVLSPASVLEMHTPAANAGLSAQGGGYGMGWFAGPHGHLADTVWHNGSAAANHSMILMLPESGWGIVLLTNAESLLYEMLARVDVIVDGIAAQLVGSAAPGTLAGLYYAFDVVVVLIAALQLRTLIRLVRRPYGGRTPPQQGCCGPARCDRAGLAGRPGANWHAARASSDLQRAVEQPRQHRLRSVGAGAVRAACTDRRSPDLQDQACLDRACGPHAIPSHHVHQSERS
jgi:CubicO group peptidase (beta-lactamase class C family)